MSGGGKDTALRQDVVGGGGGGGRATARRASSPRVSDVVWEATHHPRRGERRCAAPGRDEEADPAAPGGHRWFLWRLARGGVDARAAGNDEDGGQDDDGGGDDSAWPCSSSLPCSSSAGLRRRRWAANAPP